MGFYTLSFWSHLRHTPPTGAKQILRVQLDVEDWERLWFYDWRITKEGYAMARIKGRVVFMHREVMSAPSGLHVHHKNGDKLDNRKANLEVLTPSEHCKRHTHRIAARRKNGRFREIGL